MVARLLCHLDTRLWFVMICGRKCLQKHYKNIHKNIFAKGIDKAVVFGYNSITANTTLEHCASNCSF